MSSAPTDCRVPDPTDAKADGGFGNHRAGYSPDRLAQAEYWARKGGTLAAGEGLVLVQEIDRLRQERDAIERDHHEAVGIWRYMLRELEATAEASDALNGTLNDAIRAAVKVAEQEVGA